MTPWSPFRGAPMDGVVVNTNSERCHVCGEPLKKGERAYSSRPFRVSTYGGPGGRHLVYPLYGGRVRLQRTFRHRDCQPS